MVGSSLSGDGGRGGGGGEEEEVEEEEEEEEEEQQLGGNKNTTKKLATSWEQVAAMRKESVALRAQVAAATGVRARGVAGTTAVGPAAAAAAAVADHHPPRVAATSRRVIRRDYPIFTPVCAALCLCLCLILNLSFFLSPSCRDSSFSLCFLSVFVLLLAFSESMHDH
jgi:hypothetical protein